MNRDMTNKEVRQQWASAVKAAIDGWVDGHEMQCTDGNGPWTDNVNRDIIQFLFSHDYRVKPEPKYRPWTLKEFMRLLETHSGCLVITHRIVGHRTTLCALTCVRGEWEAVSRSGSLYSLDYLLNEFLLIGESDSRCGVRVYDGEA